MTMQDYLTDRLIRQPKLRSESKPYIEMYAVMTPGIRELVMNPAKGGRFAKLLQIALNRHMNGDWGDICEEDCAVNDEEPEYALGVYDIDGTTVWIKNDDGIRTILLPDEY